MSPDAQIVAGTAAWLEHFVVAEQLCPFAGRALGAGQVRIGVERGESEAVLARLAAEADRLLAPDRHEDATTLLVLASPRFARFDDYLDLLAIADDLLDALALRGRVQLASFHPDYRFEGEPAQDVSHWTNRSPAPLIHLLREDAVERALARHPDADAIPVRNVAHLRALGIDEVRRRARGAPVTEAAGRATSGQILS